MHPNWSPDGQAIVFSSNRTGHFELYMVKVGGGVATQLTFTKDGVDNLEHAWSPDATAIAFVRHEWNVFAEIPSYPTDSIYTLLLNSSLIIDQTGATEIYTLTVPALRSTTPLLAMNQLTFDKAPKANPVMERVMLLGALQLNRFGKTTTQERPLSRALSSSVVTTGDAGSRDPRQ